MPELWPVCFDQIVIFRELGSWGQFVIIQKPELWLDFFFFLSAHHRHLWPQIVGGQNARAVTWSLGQFVVVQKPELRPGFWINSSSSENLVFGSVRRCPKAGVMTWFFGSTRHRQRTRSLGQFVVVQKPELWPNFLDQLVIVREPGLWVSSSLSGVMTWVLYQIVIVKKLQLWAAVWVINDECALTFERESWCDMSSSIRELLRLRSIIGRLIVTRCDETRDNYVIWKGMWKR